MRRVTIHSLAVLLPNFEPVRCSMSSLTVAMNIKWFLNTVKSLNLISNQRNAKMKLLRGTFSVIRWIKVKHVRAQGGDSPSHLCQVCWAKHVPLHLGHEECTHHFNQKWLLGVQSLDLTHSWAEDVVCLRLLIAIFFAMAKSSGSNLSVYQQRMDWWILAQPHEGLLGHH